MGQLIHGGGQVIILGGNKSLTVLRANTLGFYHRMQHMRPDLSLLEINDFATTDALKEELRYVLGSLEDVVGIYCNSARNGLPLCEVLHDLNMAGRINVITSDVFIELKPYFEDGTIQATMWQDPKSQSRQSIRLMYHYLTTQKVSPVTQAVRIGVVMRSNFMDYL